MKEVIIFGVLAVVATVLAEIMLGCTPVTKDVYLTHLLLVWVLINQIYRSKP